RRTDLLTSGWPFRPDTKELRPVSSEDTLGSIVETIVNGQMTWEEGHVAAAQFYEKRGEWQKVEKEYKALINQIPLNVSAYLLLGRLYLRQGRNQEAAGILFASTKIEQTLFANRALGMLALEPKDAIPFFEKAVALATETNDRAEVAFLLADAYHRGNQRDRAVAQLQQVLQWDSSFAPARRLLERINSNPQ
ncbi:MAG: tetratricopeptide repeat protein, partial [Bacteroidota bacterium]